MKDKFENKKGFTLLVSIIVTGMLLIISFAVVNISVRQLIIADSNEESQHAFYASGSGIECAVYWDFRSGTSAFVQPPSPISCFGQVVTPTVVSSATTTFTINLVKGCVTVDVGKHSGAVTIIDSRGYNTCDAGAIRRVERGSKLTYNN